MSGTFLPWWHEKGTLLFIVRRFVPCFALLSLAWESATVPLYTLWVEATGPYIAFAILHCTLGDVLIGVAALALSLVSLRTGPVHTWRLVPIATLSTAFGTGYTVFSEWMNVTLLRSWAYGQAMPRVDLGSFELGVTPVLQWLLIPSLTLWFTRTR